MCPLIVVSMHWTQNGGIMWPSQPSTNVHSS